MILRSHLSRPVSGFLPLLIGAAALFMGAYAAQAAIINVPGDFASIQAAVNAANTGDTVLVAPGTYTAGADFEGKNITVESSGGAGVTTIDMSAAFEPEVAFVFHSGESSAAVLQGFTIEGGEFFYGAIGIFDSSPTIEQCVLGGNASFIGGGGVYVEEDSAACNPTIEQCQFYENFGGFGVLSGDPDAGYGGAIECDANGSGGENVNIINCAFAANGAFFDGAAIDVQGDSATSPTVNIVNCTLDDNVDEYPTTGATDSGAIDNYLGAVTITNTIMGDDTPVEYSTAYCPTTFGGSLNIGNSDIASGFAGTGAVDGGGNLDTDPLYVNEPGGDLRLSLGSPLINAGATGGLVPTVDLNGNPRNPTPAMGAYEYVVNVSNSIINPSPAVDFDGQVATFVDDTDLSADPSNYSATVDWGDGSGPTAATVTQPGGTGTPYVVTGDHTYATSGDFTLTVVVTADTNAPDVTGTGTSSITVGDQTFTSIVVSPGPTETYILPVAQQFTAVANDQNGNPMAVQPDFTWSLAGGSVGSIGLSSGLYHGGPVPGTATVKAVSDGIKGTSSVTVTAAPVFIEAASASPAVVNGTTTNLTVRGAYAGLGTAASLTYSWSTSSYVPAGAAQPAVVELNPVTFSDNNDTTAKNTTATFTAPGTYVFTVTITSPTETSATSSVTVTVNDVLTSITVTPGPTLAIDPTTPQQFTATAYDQFGNTLSPAISWALEAGGVGSIGTTSGLYHSGHVAGSATVEAKSSGLSGTCAVTVN